MRRFTLLLLLCLGVVLAYLVGYWRGDPLGTVPRYVVHDGLVTRDLLALGVPVLLLGPHGATAFPWKAFELWNSVSYWRDHLSTLEQVGESATKLQIYHHTNTPLYRGVKDTLVQQPRHLNMSVDSFFSNIHNTSSRYFYMSCALDLLKYPSKTAQRSLLSSIQPLSQLFFDVTNTSWAKVQLWMGDAATYPHYDYSHNIHVVINGTKRFWVSPPNSQAIYSSLHPYRTKTLDPRLLSDVATSVDVGAGAALYIPPYWLHSVETVTPAVTLSVWTSSQAYETFQGIVQAGIPSEIPQIFALLLTLPHFDVPSYPGFIDKNWIETHCPTGELPSVAGDPLWREIVDDGTRALLSRDYFEMVAVHVCANPEKLPAFAQCFISLRRAP